MTGRGLFERIKEHKNELKSKKKFIVLSRKILKGNVAKIYFDKFKIIFKHSYLLKTL